MSQTTVQNDQKIAFGSGKLEYSTDSGSTWTDLGAMKNIVFTESWEEVEVLSDNAGTIKSGIRNQVASIAGNLIEIDLAKLNSLRGGIDTYTADAGVSETLKSGGKSTQTPIQVKVTHTTEDGDIFRITLFKVTSVKGVEIAFQSDDADDPNMIPIELKGVKDVTLPVGEQLYEIYSELGESVAS